MKHRQHHSNEPRSGRRCNSRRKHQAPVVNNSTEIEDNATQKKQSIKQQVNINVLRCFFSDIINCKTRPLTPSSNRPRWHVIVSIITVALYYNSLFAELVYDDSAAIINNPDVIGRSGHHEANNNLASSETVGEWLNLWFNDYWGTNIHHSGSHKSYRPLVVITFKLNHLIHGLAPFGYHLVNLLLHLLVCNFILVLTSRLFASGRIRLMQHDNNNGRLVPSNNKNINDNDNDQTEVARFNCGNDSNDNNGNNNDYNRGCLVATLLFVVHPVHVEAVTSVVGRAELLGTLMFLISFNYYIDHCESRSTVEIGDRNVHWFSARTSSLVKSLLAATMALLCKENTITVFAINAIYDIVHQLKVSSRLEEHNKQFVVTPIRNNNNNRITGGSSNRKKPIHCFGMVCLIMVCSILILSRTFIMSGLPTFSKADNPIAANKSFLTRLLTFTYLPYFNLLLLLYPKTLSFDWSTEYISPIESCTDLRLIETIIFYSALVWLGINIVYQYYRKLLLRVVAHHQPSSTISGENSDSSSLQTNYYYKQQQRQNINLNHRTLVTAQSNCKAATSSSFTNPNRATKQKRRFARPLKQIAHTTNGSCVVEPSKSSSLLTHQISINDDTNSIAFNHFESLYHPHSSNRHEEPPKSSSPCSLSSFNSSGSSDHELDSDLTSASCPTNNHCDTIGDSHLVSATTSDIENAPEGPEVDINLHKSCSNNLRVSSSVDDEDDSGLDIVLEEEEDSLESQDREIWSAFFEKNKRKLSFEEESSQRDHSEMKEPHKRGSNDMMKGQDNIKPTREKVKLESGHQQQQRRRQRQTSSDDGLYWSGDDPRIEQLTLGMAMLTVTYLPSSNLLFYVGFLVAERTLYLPSLGFCILIALAIEWFFEDTERKMRAARCHSLKGLSIFKEFFYNNSHTSKPRINQICLTMALVPVLLLASYRTILRNSDWINERALYSSNLEVSPFKAANNLAIFYTQMSEFSDAERYFKMALSYRPNMADAHYNLGTLYHQQKRFDEAVDQYKQAIKYRPSLSRAYLNLGIIYESQHKLNDSEKIYIQCSKLSDHKLKDPIGHRLTQISCLVNLAKQYLEHNDQASKAIEILQRNALNIDRYIELNNYRLSPRMNLLATIHNIMGTAYKKLKQDSLCEKHFKLALMFNEQDASTQIRIAKSLLGEARIQEAKSVILEALSKLHQYDSISQANLRYHYADIMYKELSQYSRLSNKSIFDTKKNDIDKFQPIIDQLKMAYELQPDNYNIVSLFADIYRQSNKYLEAEKLYAKCVLLAKAQLDQLLSTSTEEETKKKDKFTSILAASHSNYGAILQLVGKLYEARREYSSALEIDQDYTLARQNLKNINDILLKRARQPEKKRGYET